MTDARPPKRRPRILLDSRYLRNPKIVALANRHKIAHLWIVCEAKNEDHEGLFASMAVLRQAAAEYRDCLPTLLDAGLLHAAPVMCVRCRKRFGDVDERAFVIHDWQDYQEPSRTQRWRDEKGVSSGHANLGETLGETEGEHSGNSLAGARALSPSLSMSTSSSPENYGVLSRDEPETAVLAYLASVGAVVAPNGNGFHRRLVLLVERQGADAVVSAMRRLYAEGDRTDRQLVLGAENELEQIRQPAKSKPKGLGPSNEEVSRAFGG